MNDGNISGFNGKLILKYEFSLLDYNIKGGFQMHGAHINLDEIYDQTSNVTLICNTQTRYQTHSI